MTARVRCTVCERRLKTGRWRACVRGCGAKLCRAAHQPLCSDVHGGQCDRLDIPEEPQRMSTTDDQPYDPSTAAANTLRDLGYTPGPQPIRQLRQVGAETLADIHLSATTAPESSGETAEAHSRLLEAAVTALGTLAESDLDEMEQQALAEAFGLPKPGDRS
jgi:hypothetical protein